MSSSPNGHAYFARAFDFMTPDIHQSKSCLVPVAAFGTSMTLMPRLAA
jgi:hypothetical protein